MAMAVEGKPAAVSGGLGGEFTAADLAAADQLVQLSVSGGGEDDDREAAASSSSSSMSARSVNNAEAPAPAPGCDGGEAGLDRRARKRYRLVSELYAATRPVKGGGGKRRREIGNALGGGRRGLPVNTAFL